MSQKKNISTIVASSLCHSCGACYAVCPTGAISFAETAAGLLYAEVNDARCIDCGLCFDVCSGHHFSDPLKQQMPQNPFRGEIMESYLGRACDNGIFSHAQSGGVVTALLTDGFQTGKIKSAAVVRMQAGAPPRPSVYLAQSADDLTQSQKSKYAPVPLLTFLKELDVSQQPAAVVGLSCHIHSLMNILDRFPNLQESIGFTVGLICDRVMTLKAIDYLARDYNSDGEYNLHYRDKQVSGYPGDVHLFAKYQASKVKPAEMRKKIKDAFTPPRCRICFDKMNVFSDITIGDPNGISEADHQHGESVIIVRNSTGKKVLDDAQRHQKLKVRTIESHMILKGQKMHQKQKEWNAYVKAWRDLQLPIPDYCYALMQAQDNYPKRYLRKLNYALSLNDIQTKQELMKQVKKALSKDKKSKKIRAVAKRIKLIAFSSKKEKL